MAKKSSAAERTIDLFAPVAPEAPVEAPMVGRVSMEEDADRNRDKAFQVQEWATSAFGSPDATGNQYRLSHRGEHYYLECLAKFPGANSSHAYTGFMVHERDLLAATTVLVRAVRERGTK